LSSKTRVSAVPPAPSASNGRSDSFASTHEALLDAVSGTPRVDLQQQPAWASEKESDSHVNHNGSTAPTVDAITVQSTESSDAPAPPESTPAEDQTEYMSRLAHEKAEERRKEEQTLEKQRTVGAESRLRELEESMPGSEPPKQRSLWVPDDYAAGGQFSPEAPVERTLWEPQTTEKSTSRSNETKKGKSNGKAAEEKASPKTASATPASDSMPEGPVIHLSSYEDRSRGESRNGAAGPRMLFDPKSGSMIEFKQETPRANGTRRSKVRGKNGTNETPDTRGRKGKQGRKDDTLSGRKKRGDGPSTKTDTKQGRKIRNTEHRLPRTLGVLYVRDKKGSAPYCADGCDGDLGYGSHSVRGGRIRNPVAHAKFVQAQQQQQFTYNGADKSQDYSFNDTDGSGGYGSGYAEEKPQELELVKGDEKLELLTGAPESPTLKATAMEWAPSGAALAAAIAHSNGGGGGSVKSESIATAQQTDDEEEADDSDPMDFIGLGFDPTQNMADVMQSPALQKETSHLEGVDLSKLALDGTPAKNIFSSYSTSSPWGTSGTNGSGDAWGGMLGKSPAATTSNADGAGSPFLSLTTRNNNTWGGGLTGFSTAVLSQDGVSGD